MSDPMSEAEPAYHLLLDPEEVGVTASALRLLIADEAHQPEIRRLARGVLAHLQTEPVGEPEPPGAKQLLSVPLSSQEMKITHTAVKLLLDDLQREQSSERAVLWRIVDKLPDEHAIRAIVLD